MIEIYDQNNNKTNELPESCEDEALWEAFRQNGYCRERTFGDEDDEIFCPVVLK